MKKGESPIALMAVMIFVVAIVLAVITFVKYPSATQTQEIDYLGYESANGWTEGSEVCNGCEIVETRCTVKFLCLLRDNYERKDLWNTVYRELPNNLWKFSREEGRVSMEKTFGPYNVGECTAKANNEYAEWKESWSGEEEGAREVCGLSKGRFDVGEFKVEESCDGEWEEKNTC
jgi:hypothetical protein